MTPIDLIEYCKNPQNGLVQTIDASDIQLSLQYKPIDYIIASELRSTRVSTKDYDRLKKDYTGFLYFNLEVSVRDATGQMVDPGEIDAEALSFLQWEFQNAIELEQNGSVLHPIMYHYQNSHNLKPHGTIVLGFNRLDEDLTHLALMISKNQLFPAEKRFEFNTDNIESIPQLKLD